MQRLGTIGQAFYMRLFFHFANLYETHKNRRTLLVSKQYEDLCAEWLGGLDLRQHKSLIMQQLGSHLDQLKGAQFLASYSIEKATTRPGFVITFKPGPAFFVDYDRYYRGKMQGNLQFQYHGDRQDHHEPMRVASLFVAKRSGVAPETVASVVTSDVEIAREMIADLGYANMDKFIVYGLRQAKKTHFDVQRLAGLRQYVASFKELEAKAVAKAASQALGRKNDAIKAERDAYESWCAAQTRKHVAALPDGVRADAEALERNRHSATPGPMQPTMIKMGTEIQLRKIANERHPLPDFETWKASRRQ